MPRAHARLPSDSRARAGDAPTFVAHMSAPSPLKRATYASEPKAAWGVSVVAPASPCPNVTAPDEPVSLPVIETLPSGKAEIALLHDCPCKAAFTHARLP